MPLKITYRVSLLRRPPVSGNAAVLASQRQVL